MISNRRNYLGLNGFAPRVLQAMRNIDRAVFAAESYTGRLYEDEPFTIGSGQTCSQPSMVAAMATMLELRAGLRVLEVGTGSGYSAAVAAQLIAPGGTLFSIEYLPELHEYAKRNLDASSAVPKNYVLLNGDGSTGLPDQAPFHRIYFTAGVGSRFDPGPLLAQLADNGIILYPEAYGSMFLTRKSGQKEITQEMRGVGFVHLQGDNSGFD